VLSKNGKTAADRLNGQDAAIDLYTKRAGQETQPQRGSIFATAGMAFAAPASILCSLTRHAPSPPEGTEDTEDT